MSATSIQAGEEDQRKKNQPKTNRKIIFKTVFPFSLENHPKNHYRETEKPKNFNREVQSEYGEKMNE
jgi:hypothetical protein